MQTDGQKRSVMDSPSVVTARRALGIMKTYIAITIFFSILATVAWNPGNYASGNNLNATSNASPANTVAHDAKFLGGSFGGTSIILLAVPLYAIPLLALAMSVLILFVYDKNNGVLEYLMSLGLSQKDIYKRYLKASLLLTSLVLAIFIPANLAYSRIVYGPAIFYKILPVYPLITLFALAVVTFMSMCMMAFSALQKARAGSNQPLGMVIGYLATVPAYFALAFPLAAGLLFDLAIVAIIALVSIAMLLSSDRLIRRETFLP